jgi:DNA mismatch repair protein MutS
MFRSILFEGAEPPLATEAPECFRDLNLDRVVEAVTAGREAARLVPFFHTPLTTSAAVDYRHAIFRDLEDADALASVAGFNERMHEVRRLLDRTEDRGNRHERAAWFLAAARSYCDAVTRLHADLERLELGSAGMRELRAHLAAYSRSQALQALGSDAERVARSLGALTYSIHVKGGRVVVGRCSSEPDLAADVRRTFARFGRDAATDRRRVPAVGPLDHVEAGILDRVAQAFPDVFAALDDFCERHREFRDDTLVRFDREVQFYVAWLQHVGRLGDAGLPTCYPRLSAGSKEERVLEAYDIALAGTRASIVTNGYRLDEPERILVVTGPNQGGKTTFARMFGQLHHLAALGCPVPARAARLHLCDEVLTHFEREEDVATGSGKLEDELLRARGVLRRATPDSVVVMNESFSATTLADALFLGTEILARLIDRDVLCVYVTFVDELSALGEATVSMVGSRAYELERRPADGVALAAAIASEHGLTYAALSARLAR